MTDSAPPVVTVSVIIPAYESHHTAAAALASLRAQSFRDFEVILVDSGSTDGVEHIAERYPEVHYHRSPKRLLPHHARSIGVGLARAELLVFTDPDIVAASSWLEELLRTYRVVEGPVAGAVRSLQRSWRGVGIHLAKFDLWLPGGRNRSVPIGASVNFLCSRELLREAGGFNGQEMIGDTLLSWELVRRGHKIAFATSAVVDHDHRSTVARLVRERFVRGADFARLRSEQADWSAARTLATLTVTILPLRLVKLMARTLRRCADAHCLGDFFMTLPIISLGHGAWLAGEASHYWRRLRR